MKKANDNDQRSDATPDDTDLEARVVAWVFGEASAFEAEQLAQILARKPELAVFKRRIEAVSGLVGEASRPAPAELRLPNEKRARVLRGLGVAATTGNAAAGASTSPQAQTQRSPSQEVSPASTKSGGRRSSRVVYWWRAAVPIAASIAVSFVAVRLLLPSFKKPRPMTDFQAIRDGTALSERRKFAEESQGDVVKLDAFSVSSSEAQPSATAPASVSSDLETAAKKPASPPLKEISRNESVEDLSDKLIGRAFSKSVRKRQATAADKPAVDDIGQLSEKKEIDQRFRFGGSGPALVQREASASSLAGARGFVGGKVGAQPGIRGLQDNQLASADPLPRSNSDNVKLAAKAPGQPQVYDWNAIRPLSRKSADSEFNRPVEFEVGQTGKNYGYTNLDKPRPAILAPQTSLANENLGAGLAAALGASGPGNRRGEMPVGDLRKKEFGKDLDVPLPKSAAEPFDETLRHESSTLTNAVSTFSLYVSDASFRIAKSALERGELPDPASVRPEEFYNAFDYGDPSPGAGERIACRVEQCAHPFLQQRNLVRIALRVGSAGRQAGQPLRLTVLVDTSGSMEREDRAATVRRAFATLATLLRPEDVITVIGFAREARLLADRVSGNAAGGLADLVARTPAEGGTNLESALELASQAALRQRTEGARNRIVLLTDGAANLGDANPARLAEKIVALRQQGIAFDACGVGTRGIDDRMLEALTRQGDGRYQVLSSPEEADEQFARALAGAFQPAAENVKVQVRFNPARVAHYRLIGFEQHRLREEDFHNDAVDAAELAADEAAVALYQVEVLPQGEGELGDVFVRFRDASTGAMVERSWTLAQDARAPAFDRASPSLKLAGTSAFLAEILRGGELAGQIRLEEFAPRLPEIRAAYARNARVQELLAMFNSTRALTNR